MARSLLIVLLMLLWAPASASDKSVRCGSKIVKIGMSMQEVLNYCGEPDQKEIEEQAVRSGNRVTGTTELHIWTYNRPTGQVPAVLEFDVDKLMTITTRKK
jgi:hypothetical protein